MEARTIAGRYRLVDRLGAGGMAEVWAADDLELGRRVAVKLLAPDADQARFEREARALASLAHPNVVRLYDFGESDGAPYMVLELLPGGSLQERLATGGALDDDEVERLATEVAAGLAAAHERGLVHRDLKPANILFDLEGRAKIADFGIARSAGAGTLTEPGTVLGTAAYISPEQAAGETATPASDVYAFGVILYRLLAGRLPFESEDPAELADMHLRRLPAPISEFRRDPPPALEAAARAALAKDPADRPADGGTLLAELTRPAAGEETTLAVPIPAPRRRISHTAFAAATLLLVAGGGIGLAYVAASDDDGPPAVATIPDLTLGRPTGAATEPPPPQPPPPTTTTEDATTGVTTEADTEATITFEPAPPPSEPPPTESITTETAVTTTDATTETVGTAPATP